MSALVDVTRERDELHDELIDERAYSAKLERQCARLAKEIGESVQRRLSEDKKRPWWRFWG